MPEKSLAQLRDIHYPSPIGMEVAIGWYALLLLLGVCILVIGIIAYKKYRHARPKRQALQLLADYKKAYLKHRNASLICEQISVLLRRTALAYFAREDIASLQGQAWLNFLNHSGKEIDFSEYANYLLIVPYQARQENINLEAFFIEVEKWLQQRGQSCLN